MTPEVAYGNNVNYCRVTGSPAEFILDFAKVVPDMDVIPISNRLMVTPLSLKKFGILINAFVVRYEAQYGKIREDQMEALPAVDTTIKN